MLSTYSRWRQLSYSDAFAIFLFNLGVASVRQICECRWQRSLSLSYHWTFSTRNKSKSPATESSICMRFLKWNLDCFSVFFCFFSLCVKRRKTHCQPPTARKINAKHERHRNENKTEDKMEMKSTYAWRKKMKRTEIDARINTKTEMN